MLFYYHIYDILTNINVHILPLMNKKNKPVYEARLKVPFHDADPMQVVWHGNYIKYFEIARDGLLDEAGVDLQSFFCRYEISVSCHKDINQAYFPSQTSG